MLGQNLLSFSTKGASQSTASQDGLQAGIQASQTMAQTDWNRLLPYKNRFEAIAAKYSINPVILLAIASRESRAGAALKNGWRDNSEYPVGADGVYPYNAFGCMQVDKRYHSIAGTSDPFSEAHINQATKILLNYYNEVKIKLKWDEEWCLKGAIAAYNSGVKNVQTKDGLNRGTMGNDYAEDVIARAQYYEENYYKELLVIEKDEIEYKRTIITAIRDTWLKKNIQQSSILSEDKKKVVVQGLDYYVIRLIDVGNGHCQVKLDYNSGTWFIFASDWEIRQVGEPSNWSLD